MAHRLVGTFILLLVSCFVPFAQTGGGSSTPTPGSPVRIEEEVIVTATRSEASLHTIGSSVTVISRAELERQHFQTIEEALATVPGLQMVRSGARGQVVSVLIRGAKSDQTLVMVDGIELNDPMNPSRGFDLGWLSLANVERIEVIRGPQSTIFGSDAIAGVINIITRTGAEKPAVTLSAEGGSYNTWNFRGEVAGEHKHLRYSLAVAQAYSSGFSAADEQFGNTEADGMRDTSASGKFQYTFNPQLDATVTFHVSDGRVDLDNWGGAYGDDPNYQQWQQRLSALAELHYAHPSGYWQQSAPVLLLRHGPGLSQRRRPGPPGRPERGELHRHHPEGELAEPLLPGQGARGDRRLRVRGGNRLLLLPLGGRLGPVRGAVPGPQRLHPRRVLPGPAPVR